MAKHNLSHYQMLTGDMGKLYPVGCVEVIPGDRFRHSCNVVARLAPMVAPVMHPVHLRVHHFFVPTRKLWDEDLGDSDNFEDFITGGADGNNADTPPKISTTGTAKDMLDYFGLPRTSGIDINAMPVRGVNWIWNEYFRDQDLQTARSLDDLTIPNICWEKDYFTTARPWTQKGADVTVPLSGSAPVKGIGHHDQSFSSGPVNVYETGESGQTSFANYQFADTSGNVSIEEDPNNAGFPGIYASLADATGASINAVRNAFALQRWAEARATWGSRYSEVLRHMGVTPQDARLQRPEYLGGGATKLQISEVLQTSPETLVAGSEYGVGDLYGHGIAALGSAPYGRRFPEHGYVISLLSIRPKAMYMDGIHRSWLRNDREDYYWKEFEGIGQQAIELNEIYASVANGANTFGYQDRYNEYREHPSFICGEFRDTLDYWHLARDLGSEPTLNSDFVSCNPSKRIFNVTDSAYDSIWMFANHRITASRLVSGRAINRIY